jgi:hypothetical protein
MIYAQALECGDSSRLFYFGVQQGITALQDQKAAMNRRTPNQIFFALMSSGIEPASKSESSSSICPCRVGIAIVRRNGVIVAPSNPGGADRPLKGEAERADESGFRSVAIHSLRLVLSGSAYVIELTRPDLVLGRHSGCDVRLPLPDVSRRHCRFAHQDGAWTVYDLQSTNGVFLNGQRVTEASLKERDILGIGGFKFEVQFGGLIPQVPVDHRVSPDQPTELGIVSLRDPLLDLEPERRKAS